MRLQAVLDNQRISGRMSTQYFLVVICECLWSMQVFITFYKMYKANKFKHFVIKDAIFFYFALLNTNQTFDKMYDLTQHQLKLNIINFIKSWNVAESYAIYEYCWKRVLLK